MAVIISVIGILLLGWAATLFVRAISIPRLRAEQNLQRIGDYGFTGGIPAGDDTPAQSLVGPLDAVAAIVGTLLGRWLNLGREDEVRRTLAAAGLYRVEPRRLLGYQALGGIGAGLLFIWLSAAWGLGVAQAVVGTIVCALSGWYFPLVWVRRQARMRLEAIEYDLPELIDLLVVAVEAGLGFGAALRAATDRLKGPLGDEMRLSLQEQTLGLTPIETLKNVLGRVETPSMRSFVRAIVQGEQLGITIGQILRNLAEEMRKRRKAAAEERAQKAPIKMLFPLIFLIFPAMFVIILGPAVFAFLDALS